MGAGFPVQRPLLLCGSMLWWDRGRTLHGELDERCDGFEGERGYRPGYRVLAACSGSLLPRESCAAANRESSAHLASTSHIGCA